MDLQTTLEGLRKKALTSALVSIGCFLFGLFSFFLLSPLGILLSLAGVLLFIFWANKVRRTYVNEYKQGLVRTSLNEMFSDVAFFPSAGIPWETVRDTQMMYTGDRFTSNDLITAKYNGIPFTQSDVHIQEEHTDSDGHTYYSTVFRGRWIIFDFNKELFRNLQVVSKDFTGDKKKGGFLSNLFSSKSEKYEKISFENEAFNKAFTVYGQNQQEAFYVLTPHIMESLLNLKSASRSPLMLMFVNGQLHVASQTGKDAFEPSVFRKTNVARDKQSIIADIRVITSFADALRLENNIYKKEN